MKALIKKYVKERNEMLKKCNVNELRKFVNEHKQLYSGDFVEQFINASDYVAEITLHKMIVNVPNLPQGLRERSALWLGLHGFSLEIK